MVVDESRARSGVPDDRGGVERDAINVATLILDTATRLRHALNPSIDDELGKLAPSFGILLQLKLAPGGLLRMSELATQTGLTPSGLTRAVDRIEDAGLVRREACPTDRRGAYAVLTELGHHHAALAMARHRKDVEEVLGTTFSARDESLLVALMQRLRDRVHPDAKPFAGPLTSDVYAAVEHLFDGVATRGNRDEFDEPSTAGTECGICDSIPHPHLLPEILYEDENWIVRHISAPYGVAGWMTMYARRHVQGIAYFDADESATFGPTLSKLQRHLEEVTGALRIYTLSLGDSLPHFHTHMVPRYNETPGGLTGWGLFDLLPQAYEGRVVVDPRDVERISAAFRASLTSP